MFKFIIVDDSELKINCLIDLLKYFIGEDDIEASIFSCRNDALRYICSIKDNIDNNTYLVLDMQFPNVNGGMIDPLNGKKFLDLLECRNINIKTIMYSSEIISNTTTKSSIIANIIYNSSISLLLLPTTENYDELLDKFKNSNSEEGE